MDRRSLVAVVAFVTTATVATAAMASPALDAALSCRKGMTKMGQFYTYKRRVLLLNCIDKLLKCEIQSEVDRANVSSCRTLAEKSCNNSLGSASTTPLSKAAAIFQAKTGAYCATADFTNAVLFTGAGGLWYGNDADCGASTDLPSLLICLRQQLALSVDESVGTLKPRAGILLDNMGLGGDFPDIPRPPAIDVIVSQTAASSGVLVSPGTLTPAAGTAVRFSGDATTLTCGGMGNNARLTITILTAGAMCNDNAAVLQQFSIKEPFGPGAVVTAGPFTSDATYCVRFKDGSCDDTVTDAIDVP